jgi:alpha-glucosidase
MGRARFSVVTPQLIRLEWAEDGIFEDRGTLAVPQRPCATAPFSATIRGDTLTLRTGMLTLTYHDTPRGFTSHTLSIRFKPRPGRTATWRYGQRDSANLGGTARTLDGADGDRLHLWEKNEQGQWAPSRIAPVDLGHGLISRCGWAVVDDSASVVLEPGAPAFTPWATARPAGRRHDLYFLGHGRDYRAALADAATVFGRQPLPPRHALGYWYSRYWAYTDREIEQMVDQFDRMDLPLDVMVIDMDWHLQGWTGYTWDPDYFPDPTALLRGLRRRGITVTLNLHPADGVGRHEAAFPAMCRDLGLDPRTIDRIPFDATDPRFMDAYFKRLHHPEEKRGVDFWWLDWQQGETTKLPGLDPLPWLNHLHWVDQQRTHPRRRPLNFSRYGGLGSGRYPVGFSGDTHSTWASLAYQPAFTATAANVLYGTWSHDIGGHQPGPIGGELYTRWIQLGVYSPILRTHTSKNREAERRVWMYPEPYRDIMMDALRERYHLIPYIYTELRRAADTAVALCRPLYIDLPANEEAYRHPGQYFFGDAMMAAPVTAPCDPATGLAAQSIWLPPGRWFDTALGALEQGGRQIERTYLLDEVPVFVRAGAVVPGQRPTRRSRPGPYPHLTIDAYPGGSGSYDLYEDDGETTAYCDGASVTMPLHHQHQGNRRTVTLGPARGTYRGYRATRPVTVTLHGCGPAATATVNGRAAGAVFDGDLATLTLDLGPVRLDRKTTIVVTAARSTSTIFARSWRGLMNRLRRIGALANLVSPPHPLHPEERLAIRVGQTGNRLTRHPENAAAELRAFRRDLKRLPRALEEFENVYRTRNDPGAADLVHQARQLLAATETNSR